MFRNPGNLPWNNDPMAGAAEATEAAPHVAVGQIQSTTGSVTVTRVSGIFVEVKPGDLLYRGDLIKTADEGAVGIVFTDGTSFNLSDRGQMVLDEFAFDPKGAAGSALF